MVARHMCGLMSPEGFYASPMDFRPVATFAAGVFSSVIPNKIVCANLPRRRWGDGALSQEHVEAFMALAVGDLSIRDVTETAGEGEELVGRVTLADGRTESFTMRAEKRPDPTPLFATMNAIAARQGAGRFIAVASAGEGLIVVWLRPEEKIAFRAWADMQYCAAGPAPVDWFD
jgi:hypothetical protein